jgi:hypothetical protein
LLESNKKLDLIVKEEYDEDIKQQNVVDCNLLAEVLKQNQDFQKEMFSQIMDLADSLDITPGVKTCGIAYSLLILGGIFGLHQFYLRRPFTAVLYATTGGLGLMGVLFDFFTLPIQVYFVNRS